MLPAHGLQEPARRAGHLHQGRLRHVAGALRPGRRVAEVRALLARPVARRGWDWTTSTSSTATGSTPRRRSRRRCRRSTRRCGQVARCTPASRPTRPTKTREAATIARELGTPLLIHQPSYSMLNRWIEKGLLDELEEQGMGCIVFTRPGPGAAHRPLPRRRARGLARGPRATAPSRATTSTRRPSRTSARSTRSPRQRGQKLAQLALQWALRDEPGHLGGHRRLVGRAARHQPRRPRRPAADRRGAGRDRPGRGRLRHEPLGRPR